MENCLCITKLTIFFLNTTSYESFGNALVEAAACGIPIVSTSVGEIPYSWEHEKNIILVNSFEAKVFSSVIGDLMQNHDLKSNLSLLARKKAEQYDISKIISYPEPIINEYEHLLRLNK